MKRSISLIFVLVFLFAFTGCSKADDTAEQGPSNLAVAVQPSTDGSGNVLFTATADNAVSYYFDFGKGEIIESITGSLTHKFSIGGTNTYEVTVKAAGRTSLTISKTLYVDVTVNGEQGLIWSDEFNTDGAPDPEKWGYDIGTGSNGWGNNELEYYTNRTENAKVEGGVLKIKAIKESYGGRSYTSARMLTMNKFAFTYGRVVARAKLPAGVGTWPAIWMLGSNVSTVGWPACGEIDIMEHRGSELNKIFGTLHYPGRSGGNADGNTTVISNATTDFHVYKLEWTSAVIRIYVDNQLIHTVVNSQSIPFNHDFFLIMNLAIGGNFAGPVDPDFSSATLEVDYIKVYNK